MIFQFGRCIEWVHRADVGPPRYGTQRSNERGWGWWRRRFGQEGDVLDKPARKNSDWLVESCRWTRIGFGHNDEHRPVDAGGCADLGGRPLAGPEGMRRRPPRDIESNEQERQKYPGHDTDTCRFEQHAPNDAAACNGAIPNRDNH